MTGWAIGGAVAALVVVLVAAVALALRKGRSEDGGDASVAPRDGTRSGPHPRPHPGVHSGGAHPAGARRASAPDDGPSGTRRDLRAVPPPAPGPGGVLPRDLAAAPGGLVLLQLSSAFCRDCRDTRAVLSDVASELPGVVHRDLDVAMRPELLRQLGVRDTPTTLLVDPRGVELLRVAGVPRRRDLHTALAPHLDRRPGASA
jgi:hypothetical protein